MSGATTARAFVEALPTDVPASEVLEQAKAAGIKMKQQTVHAIRHAMRKPAGKAKKLDHRISPQRLLLESLPDGWSTDDAIAAATKAGIALTREQANKLRYEITHNGKKGGGAMPRASVTTTKAPKVKRAPEVTERDRKLLLFKQLILELGMDQTQEIWDEFAYVRDGASARRSP